MASGGKRPNTPPPPSRKGKPWPSTLAKELVREKMRQFVNDHLLEMFEAQVAQAKGLKYLVVRDQFGKFTRIPDDITPEAFDELLETPAAVIEVWVKDPSTQAFTDLVNRAIDKPKEQPQELVVAHDEAILAFLGKWKEENRRRRELEAGPKLLADKGDADGTTH